MHHGSHVAGIAAAKSNNGLGIASVSWDSQILPLKIYPGSSSKDATAEAMAFAILDAASNRNIKVINFSTGFEIPGTLACQLSLVNPLFILTGNLPSACTDTTNATYIFDTLKAEEDLKLVCNAVAYAVNQDKIFIGAAGNYDRENPVFPAACPGAVAVGAVQPSSNEGGILGDPVRMLIAPGIGSHYGSWVTMAAAGRAITSTIPLETCGTILPPFCIANTTDGYASISGTSEAAPMVAGAAAVVLSKHLEFKPLQVINRLKQSAKTILSPEKLGAGALNVFDAVFNGDFEITNPEKAEELVEWKQHPNINSICSSKTDTLGILPVAVENNKRMLVCDNTGVQYDGIMNELDIPEGVTELPISFDWRMVSEDLNIDGSVNTTLVEYCDYYYYDCYYIMSPRIDRALVRLYNLQTKAVTPVFVDRLSNLINYGPLVSASNGWKGNNWQTFSVTVPVTAGKYQLQVQVINGGWNSTGDAITLEGSTLFMMDRVRFRSN